MNSDDARLHADIDNDSKIAVGQAAKTLAPVGFRTTRIVGLVFFSFLLLCYLLLSYVNRTRAAEEALSWVVLSIEWVLLFELLWLGHTTCAGSYWTNAKGHAFIAWIIKLIAIIGCTIGVLFFVFVAVGLLRSNRGTQSEPFDVSEFFDVLTLPVGVLLCGGILLWISSRQRTV